MSKGRVAEKAADDGERRAVGKLVTQVGVWKGGAVAKTKRWEGRRK